MGKPFSSFKFFNPPPLGYDTENINVPTMFGQEEEEEEPQSPFPPPVRGRLGDPFPRVRPAAAAPAAAATATARDPFKSEDWTDYGSPDDERPVNYAAPAAPATPAEKEQERKDALKGAAAATAGLGTGAAGRGLEPSGGLETYGRGGVASGDPTGGFGKGKKVGRRGHGRIAARAAAKRRKEQQEQQ